MHFHVDFFSLNMYHIFARSIDGWICRCRAPYMERAGWIINSEDGALNWRYSRANCTLYIYIHTHTHTYIHICGFKIDSVFHGYSIKLLRAVARVGFLWVSNQNIFTASNIHPVLCFCLKIPYIMYIVKHQHPIELTATGTITHA